MNTKPLSAYAPKARREFIAAVTARAAKFGITASEPAVMEVRDEVAIVFGEAYPRQVYEQREEILARIRQHGFEATMEAMAYTWFNRLVALRYMELHGYLSHGYRVLSHPAGTAVPEMLQHARHVDLPGLKKGKVTELLLAGNRDEDLYRHLLIAQCHALHLAMPFLFEPIDDATELLLPDNLLHSDSLIRKLVNEIPEALWQEIEIIGWLYQFYISEKKDQVIGKVVKSEDIPAATQLFTPNWIVKYMVQNSLGAQWLATYPDSPLKGKMEYYIEPAEQTDEVKAQLDAITPSQLDPEELTLIDPASGSGHILVEAYELFKAIYLERGYRQRDVPQLILEKNLFGLDIDERAAQLTGFALMMKGRADDRRLFERGVKLNVMALVDSAGFDAEALAKGVELGDYGLQRRDLTELKRLFEHATTFGSLIQVPEELASNLPALKQLSEATSQGLFVSEALKRLGLLVQQAEFLAAQYDAVVMNPPYMGSSGMNAPLKKYAKDNFSDAKENLFACFIERCCLLAKDVGQSALVTMHNWMFLSSFQKMRERLLRAKTIRTMAHLGAGAFGSISGEVVQAATFVLRNIPPGGYRPVFFRLVDGGEERKRTALRLGENRFADAAQSEFEKIPGSPVAYWVSANVRESFVAFPAASSSLDPREGLATGNNDRYVRCWPEVSIGEIGFGCEDRAAAKETCRRWFPYNKGGELRKWAGNTWFLVDWLNDGEELQTKLHPSGARIWAHNFNLDFIFRPFLTWSDITSKGLSVRLYPAGFLFDATGLCAFAKDGAFGDAVERATALGNSHLGTMFAQILNPTLHFKSGNFGDLPVDEKLDVSTSVRQAVTVATADWNAFERSWDFQCHPLLTVSSCPNPTPTLKSNYTAWITQNKDTIAEMKRYEEENNRLLIDAYSLADELAPDVPIDQITLTVNPAYRYGGKLTEEEQWTRFRQDTMEELISYAIGCMMGRYSLDAPGLTYAHSGNEGFDPSRYPTFPADDDGIVPLTDTEWFDDDAVTRMVEFMGVAWNEENLEENLAFLASNLSPRKTESSRETLRRYLCDSFFKSHMRAYKKRPIYWLFSSGKQKAFRCLVYLHRYNEGTLSRIRMDYVVPLLGRLGSRLDSLESDIDAASSAAQASKLRKESEKRKKQLEELRIFDEKLRHYADQRISLDLDDGVKVNYGKFGDLLAEVKAITGKAPK